MLARQGGLLMPPVGSQHPPPRVADNPQPPCGQQMTQPLLVWPQADNKYKANLEVRILAHCQNFMKIFLVFFMLNGNFFWLRMV